MYRSLSLALALIFSAGLWSQVPDTDLWLFKIESSKGKPPVLKDPVNITNRPGYDNQPAFSADGKKVYYVSIREDRQADIYAYEIGSKRTIPLTKSKLSEYSPTPYTDGKLLASVVVEADSAQRVHFINSVTGADEKSLETDSIGYFTFLNADTMIYYKLTQPHSLRYYVQSSGEDKWLADAPIRTFRATNRHTLVYGIKDSSQVKFYTYDFLLRRAYPYTNYASVNEDISWHTGYGLVKSEGSRLMQFNAQKQSWELLFDLSAFPLKKISRFAFDPQTRYLVVVNNL